LAPAEGEHFDQQQIRLDGGEGVEKKALSALAPALVDGFAVFIVNGGELRIGGECRRQLDQFDARAGEVEVAGRCAAGDEADVQALPGERPGNDRRAPQMADAKQMLDIEEDTSAHPRDSAGRSSRRSGTGARGRLRRPTVILPSAATANRWRANSINRWAGAPASASPLPRHKARGSPPCGREPGDRSRLARSRPGRAEAGLHLARALAAGRAKIQPAIFQIAHRRPSSAEISARRRPSHSPKFISVRR